MKRFVIVLFLVTTSSYAHAQATETPRVKVRIKNESRFLITKLEVLNRTVENIVPGGYSEYITVDAFYPSMKIDITLERKRTFARDLRYRIISYPMDNVGESRVTHEKNTLVIEIVKGEKKGQPDIKSSVIGE
jgi:hypothetical protein